MLFGQPESFALDVVSRQTVGGDHLNHLIVEQLPIFLEESWTRMSGFELNESRCGFVGQRAYAERRN